ncbi:hypothetical protein Ccrd_023275 [Cynara cardunculus var. scolymus]|uniref:Uncharacterized protein n=1 Tax=Cynara cardunculus var. scolymus TaxID=59895 RepID=A0A124SDZ1_CYNCS|nr:hypothetical protein Ccrd_023275 [Cynara cardunculus var. scolymus]
MDKWVMTLHQFGSLLARFYLQSYA